LARAGNGTSVFTTDGEAITPKVVNQLKAALQPCISGIKVSWDEGTAEGENEPDVVEIETKRTLLGFGKPKKQENKAQENQLLTLEHSQVPKTAPAIYDGERLVLYKFMGDSKDTMKKVTIEASTPEGPLSLEIPIDPKSYIEGNSVHKLMARKKIQEIEELSNNQELSEEEKQQFITNLGLKYQIASKHTAFVGVDGKENKETGEMIKRQVKNQLPYHSGHRQSTLQVDSIPRVTTRGIPLKRKGFGAPTLMAFSMDMGAPPGCPQPVAGSRARGINIAEATRGKYNDDSEEEMYDGSPEGFASSSSEDMDSFRGKGRVEAMEVGTPRDEKVLFKILSCQESNGSFTAKDKLIEMLPDIGNIIGTHYDDFGNLWLTFVVVAYLKECHQSERSIWELMVEKAEKWMARQEKKIPDDMQAVTFNK